MRKINLFAGPGAGKSTVQAELYALLKRQHYSVEMAREAAKNKIYDGIDISSDEMQIIIFGEQVDIERILKKGHISLIIADSPLLLNAFFAKNDTLTKLSIDLSGQDDLNFWINRYSGDHFESDGRRHDYHQSLALDNQLKDFLIKNSIKLIELDGTSLEKAHEILKHIKNQGTENE